MMLSRVATLKTLCRSATMTAMPRLSVAYASDSAISKTGEFVDIKTHTGQEFEKDDYRLSRFMGGKQKKVNPRWAIDLIAEIPPTPVKARNVSCNGGGGPLGHPKVFINLDAPGNHACGYCGLRFFQDHSGHEHH